MIKSKFLVYSVIMTTVMLLMLGTLVRPAQANAVQIETPTSTPTNTPPIVGGSGVIPSADEQEALKTLIQSYVEIRYRALSVSDAGGFQQNGFGNLVSDLHTAGVFLREEMAKLAVEIKRADLNQLRYIDYQYTLDFRSITVDPSTQIATILVIEGREVVYELSAELRPENPIVSQTDGIEHTILAYKKHGEWKLISDSYNDDLWRMLRPGKSTDEILQITDEMIRVLEASPRSSATETEAVEPVTTFALADDPSSHDYNRELAVQYAHDHWSENLGLYNPDYFEFPSTDCQNFVSQALYEGGNVTMFIPNPQSPLVQGDAGWFYLNPLQYASGWTDVETFFVRTTKFGPDDPETWREIYNQGPEGTLLSERLGTDPYQVPAGLMKGDVIQFEWVGTPQEPDPNGPLYDHTAIVVDIVGGEPIVAAHTIDHDNEPLSNFMPWEKIRFIHIERSNGYPPVKAEIQQNTFQSHSSDDAGTVYSPCAFSDLVNEIYFGTCAAGTSITSGFRFKSIQIPQHALLRYAYLSFTVDGYYSAQVNLQINGDYTGNSVPFISGNPPESRPPTAASVQWIITDPWIDHEYRITPQLSTVVENIVSHTSWIQGNALSLIFRNTGSNVRRVFAYERAKNDPPTWPAKLIAAYEVAGAPPTGSQTFPSVAAQDGWILESTETSGVGGSINAGSNTFTLGDNAADKQYRSILHFNITTLPQNAVITSATLRIKQQGSITGTNPFTTHGNLVADIRNPYFGTGASLVAGDFQAAAGQSGVATFNPTAVSGWYTATLTSGLSHINLNGTTQFRLAFTLDDNDDLGVDTILFSSGNNGTAANRPQLVVEYYEDQGLVGSTP